MNVYINKTGIPQRSADFTKQNDGLIIGECYEPIICLPKDQGLKPKDYDNNYFIRNTSAYLFSMSPGDVYVSYRGDQKEEVMHTILDSCIQKDGRLEKRPFSLKDSEKRKAAAYAFDNKYFEIVIFNNNVEYGFPELSENKTTVGISIDEVIHALTKTFDSDIEELHNIESIDRDFGCGIPYSCTTETKIYDINDCVNEECFQLDKSVQDYKNLQNKISSLRNNPDDFINQYQQKIKKSLSRRKDKKGGSGMTKKLEDLLELSKTNPNFLVEREIKKCENGCRNL